MNEEIGITVVGALWIALSVIVAVLVIRHLFARQSPGNQPGQSQEPMQPL